MPLSVFRLCLVNKVLKALQFSFSKQNQKLLMFQLIAQPYIVLYTWCSKVEGPVSSLTLVLKDIKLSVPELFILLALNSELAFTKNKSCSLLDSCHYP